MRPAVNDKAALPFPFCFMGKYTAKKAAAHNKIIVLHHITYYKSHKQFTKISYFYLTRGRNAFNLLTNIFML